MHRYTLQWMHSGCQKHSSANCLLRSTACPSKGERWAKFFGPKKGTHLEWRSLVDPSYDSERCWESVFVLCQSLLSIPLLALLQVEVSWNGGTPQSSILMGFSMINNLFLGTPIYGNPQVYKSAVWKAPLPSLSFEEPTQSTFTLKTEGVQRGVSRDEPLRQGVLVDQHPGNP